MARFDVLLERKFTEAELKKLHTSLDILGEIAIIDIPKVLVKKEKMIGNAVLRANPQLRAVFKKASVVKGEFRTRDLKRIAGKGSTLTSYRENGCAFKFDASEVFFTPRMSTERLRVARQVKKGESVLDMFAGVGPFAILIAKTQPSVSAIFAIDSNPAATKYLEESAALNKISDKIIIFTGDASAVVQQYLAGKATRVIMNLPRASKPFFDDAVLSLKTKGVLHFYTLASTEKQVRSSIKKNLKKCKYTITAVRKVRPYAPRIWNYVADISVERKLNK